MRKTKRKTEKLYFEIGQEEMCYPLSWFEDRIKEGDMVIYLKEAKRDFKSGIMWCSIEGDFIEKGDGTCGKHCQSYEPRNGKSGRCRRLDNTFEPFGLTLILTNEGLKKADEVKE